MPTITINDNQIHYEEAGEGPPLVLVHGNWNGGDCWDLLRAELASSHRVVSYDRRGHSRSERPDAPWTRRDNEDDLALLIEALELGPAHVVGNSYGGMVAMGLAARRPEIFRGVTIHEPPALGLLSPTEAVAAGAVERILAEIESGAVERATERFMDEIALGPGTWAQMPPQIRSALAANAPAFAVEMADPAWIELRLEDLSRVDGPIQVTRGDESPALFTVLTGRLAHEIPNADLDTIRGAGHAPQETHPAEYAELIRAFARERTQVSI